MQYVIHFYAKIYITSNIYYKEYYKMYNSWSDILPNNTNIIMAHDLLNCTEIKVYKYTTHARNNGKTKMS